MPDVRGTAARAWSVRADVAADPLLRADRLPALAHAAVMPRVKPQTIETSSHRRRLGRRRRRRGGEGGARRRSSTSSATRSASSGSARACRRECCSTARPAPARRCSRRPSRTSRARRFYSQSASAFVEMFAGPRRRPASASSSQEARKNAPAIVFIDELDAVGTARQGGGFNREQDQTLNQLLVELDGFDERDQVVVMGASNRLQDLDPALLRPGRFDRQVLVGAARPERPRGDPARAHERQAARDRRRPRRWSRARRPASPAPTSRTSATRRRSSPAATSAARSRMERLRRRDGARASPACSSGASSPRRRSGSSPTTRPGTR